MAPVSDIAIAPAAIRDSGIHEPLTVRVIRENSEFHLLKDEWNRLLAQSASDCLFLSWDWLHTWWLHFGKAHSLHLIEVRCSGTLLCLAPLAFFSRRLEFIGSGAVGSDYLDVIVRPGFEEVVADTVAEHLQHLGLAIRFGRIRAGSFAQKIVNRLRQRGCHVLRGVPEMCPFLPLSGRTWETLVGLLGPSHRSNVRRRLRKISESGLLRCERTHNETERQRNFQILVDLHRRCWQSRGGSDGLHNDELVSFHDAFTRIALEKKCLRLDVLHLDGRPVAAIYGIRHAAKFYFYQSGYDPAFSNLSVGLVALALSIRHAIAEGVESYDFLHGDEEYKFRWTQQFQMIRSVEIFPASVAGALTMLSRRAVAAMKRMVRRVINKSQAAAAKPAKPVRK